MYFFYENPNILFSACHHKNQTEIIKDCIKSSYKINQQNFIFQTPLILASKNNNLTAVQILAENGADLNVIDIKGTTALGYAQDQSKVQKYLKSKGAKCFKNSTQGMSNLKTEIKHKQNPSPTTKEIINKKDSWGFSPFMWTISHENQNHFKNYLALGADINQKCRNGTTPLMLACLRKNFKMVKILIKNGASVNYLDVNGNSALTYSAGHIFDAEIADLLVEKSADIHGLIAATFSWDLSVLKFFLTRKADVNVIDITGNTALAYASYFGKIELAKILIENKAELDLCGDEGKTALSWAAVQNNVEMVKLLLRKGAKINHEDAKGRTALSYAKQHKNETIIEYLKKVRQE